MIPMRLENDQNCPDNVVQKTKMWEIQYIVHMRQRAENKKKCNTTVFLFLKYAIKCKDSLCFYSYIIVFSMQH